MNKSNNSNKSNKVQTIRQDFFSCEWTISYSEVEFLDIFLTKTAHGFDREDTTAGDSKEVTTPAVQDEATTESAEEGDSSDGETEEETTPAVRDETTTESAEDSTYVDIV